MLPAPADTTKTNSFQMVQRTQSGTSKKNVPLFCGYGIYTDICGLAMAQFSNWGQYEVGAHVGIKGKYFPAVELGIGQSNASDNRSHLHYNTHSPYFRIGLDYNLNKKVTSHNRYFVGARYGFSSFRYDISGPNIVDHYWNTEIPFQLSNVHGNAHWCEILFGIQTQVWKFINLGWTFRYRARLSENTGETGHAYYIPGYGKGGSVSHTLGGTFNLIFEL